MVKGTTRQAPLHQTNRRIGNNRMRWLWRSERLSQLTDGWLALSSRGAAWHALEQATRPATGIFNASRTKRASTIDAHCHRLIRFMRDTFHKNHLTNSCPRVAPSIAPAFAMSLSTLNRLPPSVHAMLLRREHGSASSNLSRGSRVPYSGKKRADAFRTSGGEKWSAVWHS